MKPDEIFVVALLLFSVALVAGFAIYSRRAQAASSATLASEDEVIDEPADVGPATPPAARSADRRRRRGGRP